MEQSTARTDSRSFLLGVYFNPGPWWLFGRTFRWKTGNPYYNIGLLSSYSS
ncbi:hypothetical protein ANCCAN_09040 [Ancylostoma caninum]|uniref:Uncharacterized protein n=1 Tax=Ancylostoma caninum TaxID=29170 RepID=A0A368GKQ0_ANCCA|nr:hypothetical protein ANCCAN_09040 [Ancylostoma caninum]